MAGFGFDRSGERVYKKSMSALPWLVMAAASAAVDYTNPIAQPGEPGWTAQPKNHLRVLFENDSAAGKDQNYTHGTRIDYARSFDERNGMGLSLTQNIYTPETHTRRAVPGEHPYAGYLGFGGAYLRRGDYVGCSTELQIGTTGNASFARYSQDAIHRAGNMARWDGWSYQVPAEVTFELSGRQDYRLPFVETEFGKGRWQTDGLVFTRENVGTVDISGGVGITLRCGHNLPSDMSVNGNHAADYSLGLIRADRYKPEEMSYFLVASAYGYYMARDITIDGGVFHDFKYQTCSRMPWQGEAQFGLGVVHQGINYFAGITCHSRTYRTEEGNHWYGSFAISWNW